MGKSTNYEDSDRSSSESPPVDVNRAEQAAAQNELRKKWRAHFQALSHLGEIDDEDEDLLCGNYQRLPEFPDELRGLTCGAKTRSGTPCKQKALFVSGRCKFHGGLSTGPVTEAGREQARVNGRKGGRPRNNPSPWTVDIS